MYTLYLISTLLVSSTAIVRIPLVPYKTYDSMAECRQAIVDLGPLTNAGAICKLSETK